MGLLEKLMQKTQELPEKIVEEVKEEVTDPIRKTLLRPLPLSEDQEVDIDDEEEEEDDETYTQRQENSADALIDMIDLTQKAIFGFWGAKKLKKKIPEKIMEEFINIDLKDLAGEPLTPEEEKKLKKYKDFDRRMQFLLKDIPFTDEERADLKKATQAFVKEQKIVIPPTLWFSVQVLSKASERFITIATM